MNNTDVTFSSHQKELSSYGSVIGLKGVEHLGLCLNDLLSILLLFVEGLENDGHNGSDDASGNFISSDIEENESTLDESRISRRRIQRSDSDARIRPSHRTMKPVSNMCEFGFRGVQFIRRGIIEGLALIIAVLFALGNLFLSTIRLVAHTVQRIFLKLFMPNAPIYLTEKPIHPRLSHFHEDKDSGRLVCEIPPSKSLLKIGTPYKSDL